MSYNSSQCIIVFLKSDFHIAFKFIYVRREKKVK